MHLISISWMNVSTMLSSIASYLKDSYPRKKRISMMDRHKCQDMYWMVFPNWQQLLKTLCSWLWMDSCYIGISNCINSLIARYSSQLLIPHWKHVVKIDKAMWQQKVNNMSKESMGHWYSCLYSTCRLLGRSSWLFWCYCMARVCAMESTLVPRNESFRNWTWSRGRCACSQHRRPFYRPSSWCCSAKTIR